MIKAIDIIYANLKFTHKVHEKQAELLSFGSIIIRIVLLLSLIGSLGLQLLQLLPEYANANLNRVAILVTLAGVGLSFYQLTFNYDKLLELHRNTAKDLLAIRNRITVAMDKPVSQQDLNKFVEDLNQIYKRAPQTGWLAKIIANKYND